MNKSILSRLFVIAVIVFGGILLHFFYWLVFEASVIERDALIFTLESVLLILSIFIIALKLNKVFE